MIVCSVAGVYLYHLKNVKRDQQQRRRPAGGVNAFKSMSDVATESSTDADDTAATTEPPTMAKKTFGDPEYTVAAAEFSNRYSVGGDSMLSKESFTSAV